jgi:pimeloyl-ACP methyl ester carboxylesterase
MRGEAVPDAYNGDVRISWQECGVPDAPPVLLVMGHVFGSGMWHRTVPALAAQHRVLTYDNWGIGESGCPREPATIELMAADAEAVLSAAGVEEAHVYGVSMGGLVAQELALSAPERVTSLVLGCTGAPSDATTPRRGTPALAYRVPRRLFYALGRSAMYGSGVSREQIAEDMRVLTATRTDSRGLIAQSRAIRAYRSFDRVAGITAPTLVLHGDEDKVVPLERARELVDLIPSARLQVLPGAGHNFTAGCAAYANQLVLDFFAQHPVTRRNRAQG